MKHEIRIDRSKPLRQQSNTGHNRWHFDIQPILTVEPGDIVMLETRDAMDGVIRHDTTLDDLARVNLDGVHPLTGPVYVSGAEPGNILEVKVLEVTPQPYGFTVLIPGFGLLREYFPTPFIASWELDRGFAVSAQLPGVRIPGAPFMGVIGVAPSRSLLERISAREAELLQRGGMVLPPSANGAVPSSEPVASEGLRTIPPRENGGNIDIKQLTSGTTILFPVFVKGALFSAGDAHFAQGDGESCGTAVEMGATLTVQFSLREKKQNAGQLPGVQFEYRDQVSAPAGRPRDYYVTTGIPITGDGRNESEDITLATRNALLSMIDYLVAEHGFTRQQAYALTSVAVDLRISQAVDVPNVMVSAFLPLDVFHRS